VHVGTIVREPFVMFKEVLLVEGHHRRRMKVLTACK